MKKVKHRGIIFDLKVHPKLYFTFFMTFVYPHIVDWQRLISNHCVQPPRPPDDRGRLWRINRNLVFARFWKRLAFIFFIIIYYSFAKASARDLINTIDAVIEF